MSICITTRWSGWSVVAWCLQWSKPGTRGVAFRWCHASLFVFLFFASSSNVLQTICGSLCLWWFSRCVGGERRVSKELEVCGEGHWVWHWGWQWLSFRWAHTTCTHARTHTHTHTHKINNDIHSASQMCCYVTWFGAQLYFFYVNLAAHAAVFFVQYDSRVSNATVTLTLDLTHAEMIWWFTWFLGLRYEFIVYSTYGVVLLCARKKCCVIMLK